MKLYQIRQPSSRDKRHLIIRFYPEISKHAYHIEISGGTVNAWSNYAGAGIGGGRNGSGRDISITGGNVNAQGWWGAGIGGGMNGDSGNILIKDTTLTAQSLPLYPNPQYEDAAISGGPAVAVGRGSNRLGWTSVLFNPEFGLLHEENVKIGASDGKTVQLSATGWQWRRSQGEYEWGWGTTVESLIPNENGRVDLQRLSLPYACNYGRVIGKLELRCYESTCSHEFGWVNRDDCHIWACVNCGARDPAAEMSKQNAKHIPGDWGNQKQLCTVCGHVMGTDTKAPVLEGLKDGESYTVEDTIDGKPGAYTFTVSDPAASGETSSGIKSVTINGEPQDGPTYRLPAPDGGNNDAGAEHTVVATDNAGNTTMATVKIYRRHHVKVISPDGNGTASASPDKAVAGTEITLTATPKEGYRFKEWQVVSPAELVITNNKFTMPDSNVEVKAIFKDMSKEQFDLAPGGRYYFDLSAMDIPGTVNGDLPDSTLHYVPFTYAGMVNAYKLTSAMETTEEYAEQNKYDHSLFVAEYNVTRAVSWIDLNTAGLIFGKDYTSDGVDYTLRAPSVGSASTGSYDLERGTPQSNEWDKILDKGNGYIKNWEGMESWGQDIMEDLDVSAHRGHMSARYWNCSTDTFSQLYHGFRPVLEVLGLDTLGADGLKAVTLDLGDGKLGVESSIQIIVIDDSTFTAPASDGLTRPDGNTGSYFMWLGSDGKLYDPGDNVPADVTKLTAQFASSSHSVTITTATLPDGKVGEAYSHTLTTTGTAPITWSVDGGLPAGLSLNVNTGEISGTPTADGTAKFTVKATNSAGSDTKELSITITKAAPPSHEHSYGDWRKDGTSHWHECTDADCPNREESIKDKAAHVYTDDTDTTCNVCGYERTVTPPSHEHSYGDWHKDGTSHWHECTDADCPDRNESIKDKAAHVYDDDTDTTCDVCGYKRTVTPPAHEHNYGDWSKDGTSHWHECTDADCPNREESIKDKAAHVYDDDADTICDVCGYERTVTPPSHEHSYGDWSKDGTSHWHECTDADCPNREESIKDKAAHVYDDDADTTCDTCGYERTVAPPAPTEFIVTFDGNGGTPSVGSMTTTDQKLTSLPSASRSGSYSFDGWYTEKSGGTKVTTDTEFHANTTVHAHWTYIGGGGSSSYSYYTIKATAGTGGSISPSGNVSVREGRDQTFTITPDKGYAVSNVKIDGRSIGVVKSYTFENVKRAYTIEVSFTRANEFIDVPAGSYYYDTVLWAVENGITTGASASRFDPNGICTRAQAVTFLWRAAGSPKPETRTMPFTDVPVGSYYYDAVLWAVENGITKGTSDTTFSPNDTCTRAQIVSFLWRSEKTPVASSRNPFTDVKPGAYYLDAVLWVVESGITKGTTAMKFSPDADCTRAQIVTFLWRCKK